MRTSNEHSATTVFLVVLHLGLPLRRTLDLPPAESMRAPRARRPDSLATLAPVPAAAPVPEPSDPDRIWRPSAARPSWLACFPRRLSGERSGPSPVGPPFAMEKNGT